MLNERSCKSWKRALNRDFWEAVVILKITIVVGLTAAYFLPSHVANAVTYGVNLLWLWKL